MSSDIEKLAVFDDRIVQTRPKFAVSKGALSLTNSPFPAIGATSSQHTYQITVPSENVFIDRAVDWTSTCYLQFDVTVASVAGGGGALPAGTPLWSLGLDGALAAFPLHTLAQTITATINDTTTTINTSDVLREILRLTDYKPNRLQRTCPTYLDTYASYDDAFGASNNPLGDYADSGAREEMPNGAFYNVTFTDDDGAIVNASPAFTNAGYNLINNVPVSDGSATSTTGKPLGVYTIYLQFTSTEKLVLSPFVFSDIHEYDTGLFGIQNIQLVMNMAAPSSGGAGQTNFARVIRSTSQNGRSVSNVAYNSTVSGGSPFKSGDSRINVQFLTPSLDLPLPPKSVVPYMEFPRFISSQSTTIAAGTVASGVSTQTITLPQIPDMLLVYAKPNVYQPTDADYYLPITRVSVNFDNFAGLLSSHTTEQLYAMSVKNGLDMDWNQWIGEAKVASAVGGDVQTTGGFLVLKPSQDIVLQSGQAPSLVGNYTLQMTLSISNPGASAVTSYNIYIVTVNSGFFESIKGSSRIVKGVLTEEDIIPAPLAPAGTRASLHRLVGAGFMDNLANVLTKVKEVGSKALPIARAVAPMLKPMLPRGAQNVMSAVGLGVTGGAAARGRRKLAERLME